MARGGQYRNGGYSGYEDPYYTKAGPLAIGPPPGPPPPPMGPPPGPRNIDRLTRSRYPDKNSGSLVRGGRVGMLKFLAGAQLVTGLALMIVGVVHIALGPLNMALALITGMTVLWCPAGSIGTGIVGLFLSRGNSRDFVCIRRSYQVMTMVNAFVFMPLEALCVGFVQLRYFDSDAENIQTNEKLLLGFLAVFQQGGTVGGLEMEGLEPKDIMGYMSVVGLILALCCLNVLFALISMFIICCGAPFEIEPPEPIVIREPGPPPPPEPLYDAPPPPPLYMPRSRTPPPRIRELPISRPRTRYMYEDDYAPRRNYRDDYRERDFEKMMSNFKDARRKHGTIRSDDFDRYFGRGGRRHRRARSFDDMSYMYDPRDIYSDY